MMRRPPRSTLFPHPPLFRSVREPAATGSRTTDSPMPALAGGKYARLDDPLVRAATKYLRRKAPISVDRHRRDVWWIPTQPLDRKSTRLNSSHLVISYAVFCL